MNIEAGVLSVTLEYGKGLKDADWFGKQDHYCTVRVGDQTLRTRTAWRGGKDPAWSETFSFSVVHEDSVEVEVKAAGLCTGDDLLGAAAFTLGRARQAGSDQLEVPVVSGETRTQRGFIAVSLRWEARSPAAAPEGSSSCAGRSSTSGAGGAATAAPPSPAAAPQPQPQPADGALDAGPSSQPDVRLDINFSSRAQGWVREAAGQATDRAAFLTGLLDRLEQELEREGRNLNILVANLATDRRAHLCGEEFHTELAFRGCRYGVWLFEHGCCELTSEAGPVNWGYRGPQVLRDNAGGSAWLTFVRRRRGRELRSHAELHMHDTLSSPSGRHVLIMQYDGNLVLYDTVRPNPWGRGATWASNTYGRGQPPFRAALQDDGSLAVYDGAGTRTWSSGYRRGGRRPFRLAVQDDGNVVMCDADGGAIWATNTGRMHHPRLRQQ